jgi:hypothetical protein
VAIAPGWRWSPKRGHPTPCLAPRSNWPISRNATATTGSGIPSTLRCRVATSAVITPSWSSAKPAMRFFADSETGILGQFRHQYFLMNLMAHFQKAALMLFSEWLVVAISKLDIRALDSIKAFKREIRLLLGSFLRFTERYWFPVVSNQAQVRDLVPAAHSASGHRPDLSGRQCVNQGHESIPGQRQSATAGEHRGAPDGGDHTGADRHRVDRLPRHEHH